MHFPLLRLNTSILWYLIFVNYKANGPWIVLNAFRKEEFAGFWHPSMNNVQSIFHGLGNLKIPTEKCKGISFRKINYNSVARQSVNRHIQQKIYPLSTLFSSDGSSLHYHSLLQLQQNFFLSLNPPLQCNSGSLLQYNCIHSRNNTKVDTSGQITLHLTHAIWPTHATDTLVLHVGAYLSPWCTNTPL